MSLPRLEICLSPALFHLFDPKGKTVVIIDILRATSTICTALWHGIEKVIAVETLRECSALEQPGYLLAAERGGQKPEGFHYGNSPFDYMDDAVAGKTLVLTTTNGTRALAAARAADKAVIGSFLNLSALTFSLSESDSDIILFCAGWRNHFSLEDTLFAGALANRLARTHSIGDDGVVAAVQLFKQAENHLFDALERSFHFQRLRKMGIEKDLRYCTQIDKCPVLPIAFEDGVKNTI